MLCGFGSINTKHKSFKIYGSCRDPTPKMQFFAPPRSSKILVLVVPAIFFFVIPKTARTTCNKNCCVPIVWAQDTAQYVPTSDPAVKNQVINWRYDKLTFFKGEKYIATTNGKILKKN